MGWWGRGDAVEGPRSQQPPGANKMDRGKGSWPPLDPMERFEKKILSSCSESGISGSGGDVKEEFQGVLLAFPPGEYVCWRQEEGWEAGKDRHHELK